MKRFLIWWKIIAEGEKLIKCENKMKLGVIGFDNFLDKSNSPNGLKTVSAIVSKQNFEAERAEIVSALISSSC